MKKLQILFCVSFFIFSFSFSNGQSWLLVKEGINLSNNTACDPTSIAADNKGNVFEAGAFEGTIKYDLDTIASIGIPSAVLIKYDSNGNVLWAKNPRIANVNCASNALTVTTDKIGNSYITGYFTDTITFGTFKLTSKGTDAFLVKFAPNGNVLWAKSSEEISGGLGNAGFSVTTDKSCNIYVAGQFRDTISFGSLTVITHNLSRYYAFLEKYDSNGNALWIKSGLAGVTTFFGGSYSVNVDSNKNIYLTGTFFDTAIFGTYSLVTHSTAGSIFLVKYDSNGNVKWAKSGLTANLMFVFYNNISNSIMIDRANNIYITGQFLDSITFDSYKLSGISQRDIFLVKYDSSGKVIWARCGKSLSNTGAEGYSLSADRWNHFYLAGGFGDSISFGSVKLVSSAPMPSCIFMFDTSGNALCGTIINNLNDDANGVAVNPVGQNVYFGGDVGMGTCVFGNDTLHDGGTSEYSFIAKWVPCNEELTSINPVSEKSSVILFPNPNKGIFTIALSANETSTAYATIKIYNILGGQVYGATLKQVQGDNLILLSNQPNGIYLYRVINANGELLGSGKIIIDK